MSNVYSKNACEVHVSDGPRALYTLNHQTGTALSCSFSRDITLRAISDGEHLRKVFDTLGIDWAITHQRESLAFRDNTRLNSQW